MSGRIVFRASALLFARGPVRASRLAGVSGYVPPGRFLPKLPEASASGLFA